MTEHARHFWRHDAGERAAAIACHRPFDSGLRSMLFEQTCRDIDAAWSGTGFCIGDDSAETEINLTEWCGSSDRTCPALTRPFVRGGWRYATDGSRAIRVPTTEPDTPMEELFLYASRAFAEMPAGEGLPWPAEGPAEGETRSHSVVCRACSGSGRADYRECAECEGEGETECPTCGNAIDCAKCGGAGFAGSEKKCQTCDGTGFEVRPVSIRIGEHWIDIVSDAAVRRLPNPRYIQSGFTTFIRFDGGEAIVMGMEDRT